MSVPQTFGWAVAGTHKGGGVYSLQLYESVGGGTGLAAPRADGPLRTLCPYRFEESGTVNRWIAETFLGASAPIGIPEVGFLRGEASEGQEEPRDDVGRIDLVLVDPKLEPLHWCAVEMQAVYFSGSEMNVVYDSARDHSGSGASFPAKNRQPAGSLLLVGLLKTASACADAV